ncbi:MAG: metallophosphoesterase, partial [Pseudomonadota bacterium]
MMSSNYLQRTGIIFLGLFLSVCLLHTRASGESGEDRKLSFTKNKTFKIVQFTDTQDDQDIDPRTVALIEAVLDDQKPNLVVFTGDNIQGGCKTPRDVDTAIDN